MDNNFTNISHDDLKFSDFFREDSGEGVFLSGDYAPDRLTELRQIYEAYGAAPLRAQLEIAWQNDDDDTARDILSLIKSYEI